MSERNGKNRVSVKGFTLEQCVALDEIREIIRDSLTERGIEQWLHGRNRLLDGRRPVDVIAEGGIKEVRKAAWAFIDGSYV